jgi:ribosome-associated protein
MTAKENSVIGATRLMMHGVRRIPISGEFIRLDALLKYASIASTGGEAKMLIQNGEVFLGKQPCTQRGKKIRHGDIVRFGGETLVVKQKDSQ